MRFPAAEIGFFKDRVPFVSQGDCDVSRVLAGVTSGVASDDTVLFCRADFFGIGVLGNLLNFSFGFVAVSGFFFFCFFAGVSAASSIIDEASVSSRFRFDAAVFILSRQLWQFFQYFSMVFCLSLIVRSLLQTLHLGGGSGAAVDEEWSAMLSGTEPGIVIVFVYLNVTGDRLLLGCYSSYRLGKAEFLDDENEGRNCGRTKRINLFYKSASKCQVSKIHI